MIRTTLFQSDIEAQGDLQNVWHLNYFLPKYFYNPNTSKKKDQDQSKKLKVE